MTKDKQMKLWQEVYDLRNQISATSRTRAILRSKIEALTLRKQFDEVAPLVDEYHALGEKKNLIQKSIDNRRSKMLEAGVLIYKSEKEYVESLGGSIIHF